MTFRTRFSTRGLVAAAFASGVALAPLAARADGPSPPPPPPPPAEVVGDRLVLEVTREPGAPLDPEALRAAIARELRVEVALAAPEVAGRGTIRVRAGDKKATVSFGRDEAPAVERTVELPKAAPVATELVALLVANLVVDEASPLVEGLRQRAKAKADAEAKAAAPEPAPAPVPAPAPAPVPVRVPAPVPRPVRVSPCDRPLGAWPVTVDLVPFAGTSAVAAARASTRTLAIGLAADLGAATRGVDVAGALALATESTCGVQVGGAVAVTLGPVDGVQVAPVAIAGDVTGVQVGTVTVAAGDVEGVQVSVANVATGRVHGAQVGLLNFARAADVQVGLVSLQQEGRTYLEASATDSALLTATVVHGGDVIHNLYGVGARVGDAGERFALSLGIGARFLDTPRWTLDLDAIGTGLARPSTLGTWSLLSQVRFVAGFRITDAVAVAAGPTASFLVTEDPGERPQTPLPLGLDEPGSTSVRGWTGAVLALRLFDGPRARSR